MARHARDWFHPRLQVYSLRLLGAIPVYYLCSFGGLLFPFCQATFVLVRSW